MGTKAHLVLPQEILDEIDRIAGKRKRSLFIAEATREKLEREAFGKALGVFHPSRRTPRHEARGPAPSFVVL